MVARVNKLVFQFLLFASFLTQISYGCAVISGRKLLDQTAQGKKAKQEIADFEKKVIDQVEKARKHVAAREQEVLKLQKEYNLKVQQLAQLSKQEQKKQKSALQKQEQELDSNQQQLFDLQEKFTHLVEQAKDQTKKKYDIATHQFYKNTLDRWASLYHWDIVFPANTDLVLYAKSRFDVTDKMIDVMQVEYATHGKTYESKSEILKLFANLGVLYLDANKIDPSIKVDLDATKTAAYLQHKIVMDKNTAHYGTQITEHKRAPFCVKWISDKVGFGVFATANIKAGDLIQEYTGILREVQTDHDDLTYAWMYPIKSRENFELCVDGKHAGNEIRFINHSNHPNCMQMTIIGNDKKFHICYVAKFDIKSGEQILVSYGNNYWTSRNYYEELA